ncbi:type II toxin-antitoxin system Phd/YefM family antitoxin [Asticcacaulis sp. AC402]|uniref:type II toxin-antitoxin system Phd/YefM family antitoxin n=1 Tax=Asticcacaulis sp. AC402 TaxID=1282361 RepID=UPI0003C3E3AE|nr:type II toxin-antitoxin system Phd/YefM family antitoxin [Asticcacaulis sp. AC402]ESQ74494.1 prevent-host-death protein [Asticcacaulis sp. AC402]
MTTLTSREFNQDVGRAKREARLEPVFITDRGRPSHVLLSFEAFRQITGQTESLVDLLAMAESPAAEAEFESRSRWETREERF